MKVKKNAAFTKNGSLITSDSSLTGAGRPQVHLLVFFQPRADNSRTADVP